MVNLIFFALSPFLILLVSRAIIPLYWLLVDEEGGTMHGSAVCIAQCICYASIIMVTCIVALRKMQTWRETWQECQGGVVLPEPRQSAIIPLLSLLSVSAVYLLTGTDTPLFMSSGSDAAMLVYMNANTKSSAFAADVVILSLSVVMVPLAFFNRSTVGRLTLLLCCVLLAIHSGKKSGLILLVGQIALVAFGMGFRPGRALVYCAALALVAGAFFSLQFLRTTSHYGNDIALDGAVPAITNMIYGSSTSLYEQMFAQGGLSLAVGYSDHLGSMPAMTYWGNSYTKILFGTGIDQSIGPFLSSELYGNMNPNGVNPTLPFEFIFVFGSYNAGWFGVLLAIPIGMLTIKLLGMTLGASRKRDQFKVTLGLLGIWFMTVIFADSLYAMRMTPVIPVVACILYLHRFVNRSTLSATVSVENSRMFVNSK